MTNFRVALLLCCGISLAGCDKHPTRVLSTPVARAWIGTFSNESTGGDIVLDLVQTGGELRGEAVIAAPMAQHLYLQGYARGDSFDLALDHSRVPYSFDFTLRARLRPDGWLQGNLAYSPAALAATLTCRPLRRLQVTDEAATEVSYGVGAIAFDGQDLWLSTATDDFVRMTPAGAIRDTVVIYYRGDLRWTSTALTYDGSRLWGFLPGTVMVPGGTNVNYMDVVNFTAAGRSPDSLRLWHRTNGLAFDGADLWSLRSDGPKAYRFTRAGVVTDSVYFGIPDAVHLEFDGRHFWTLGWYMKRLYQCDADGQPVAIGDVPGENTGSSQGGLAVVGSRVWTVETHLGSSTIHRLTVQ